MCTAVTCPTCRRTTWAGCGRHVEQVMSRVPPPRRCPGHPTQDRAGSGWFARLLTGARERGLKPSRE